MPAVPNPGFDPAAIQRTLAALLARIEKLERSPRATHTSVRGGSFTILEETGEDLVKLDKEGITVYNLDGNVMLTVRDDGLFVFDPDTDELKTALTAEGITTAGFSTHVGGGSQTMWVEVGDAPDGAAGNKGAIILARESGPRGILYATNDGGFVLGAHPDSDEPDNGFVTVSSTGDATLRGAGAAFLGAGTGNANVNSDDANCNLNAAVDVNLNTGDGSYDGDIHHRGYGKIHHPIRDSGGSVQLAAMRGTYSDLVSPPGPGDPDEQHLMISGSGVFTMSGGQTFITWPYGFPNGCYSCFVFNGDAGVHGGLILSTFDDFDTTGVTAVARIIVSGAYAIAPNGNYRLNFVAWGW